MSEKDGGPAFPQVTTDFESAYGEHDGYPNTYSAGGMTLRDWFAGQALSQCHIHFEQSTDMTLASDPKGVANYAYDIADAMLKARAK